MSREIKFIELVHRRPDISDERFHYHWRAIHGPIGAAMANVGGYLQLHRIAPALPGLIPAGCEGVVEAWFEDEAALRRNFDDPVYLTQAVPDQVHFLDRERKTGFLTYEHVVLAGEPDRSDAVKAVLLLKRAERTETERFDREARDAIAALVDAAAPAHATETLRYDGDAAGSTPAFDAVAFLAWSTLAELEAAWAAPAVTDLLPDLAAFADLTRSRGFVGEQHRVK